VGAEFSSFSPEYIQNVRDFGPGVFVDYNLHPKWGAEGEARWMHWNTNGGTTEQMSNYLAGPRYRIHRFHRLSIWGKFLLGAGLQTYPAPSEGPGATSIGNGSYFAYTPGISGDYRITSRISVRGDYEYQFWPSAPGIALTGGVEHNNLQPNGFSVGFSYRLLGQ
jgi:hypothetical protein